ncbi:MAG: cobalamin-binding protein [Zoogloeaceae bacterium]|jgi:iron complex transport system substrate-binding protein|nr:cobalamin-binding protein [Zoogloeaceae bacterium]
MPESCGRQLCFFAGLFLFVCFLFAPVVAQGEIVVRDDVGHEIRLAHPARRIVSLAPHATETLYAAGAGHALAGAVAFSDYPPAARSLPQVGNYTRLDLEAILNLKPDLVIAWESGNPPAQLAKLRAFGIPVFVTQPNTMEDIARQLEAYGRLAGTEALAGRAAAEFRARLARLAATYSGRSPVRVFYQIWKGPLFTVGKPQIITRAIQLCGGVNIYGHLEQMAPTVSLEAVLAADPEAIVATGMADARPEWLDDWKLWPRLAAVRYGNLFHINPDIMQRHTPRLLEGTETLCQQLETARKNRQRVR